MLYRVGIGQKFRLQFFHPSYFLKIKKSPCIQLISSFLTWSFVTLRHPSDWSTPRSSSSQEPSNRSFSKIYKNFSWWMGQLRWSQNRVLMLESVEYVKFKILKIYENLKTFKRNFKITPLYKLFQFWFFFQLIGKVYASEWFWSSF